MDTAESSCERSWGILGAFTLGQQRVFLQDDLSDRFLRWAWLFRGSWAKVGVEYNTRQAVAKRIAWFIRHHAACAASYCCAESTCDGCSRLAEYAAREPDWKEIKKMIPKKNLKGIEWREQFKH